MKSPFPGMDPYLERHWRDVHTKLVAYTADTLNAALPGELIARAEERIVIDDAQAPKTRAIYPDVRVYADPTPPRDAGGVATVDDVAVAAPIVLEAETEPHAESYVTILDASGQLVTVVEVLSPSTKLPGADRDAYRMKRSAIGEANVHVVEVDLLRAGSWREWLSPLVAPAHAESAYRVVVRRAAPRRRVELYPISLRQRLPRVPIPLRATDPDLPLDLQPLVDQAYRNGRYDRTRYNEPCDPPLTGEDAAWAEALFSQSRTA